MKNIFIVHIIIGLTFIFFNVPAHAQQGVVKKVQGRRAIVEFKGKSPPVGETVSVGGGEDSMGSSSGGSGGGSGNVSRDKIIGLAAEISMLSTKVGEGEAAKTTNISVTGKYGWNAVTMEYGPIATIRYSAYDGGSSMTLGAGGFFDYNLVPNKMGEDMVYGIGIEGAFTSSSSKQEGGDSQSSSGFQIYPSGFLKWFVLAPNLSLRTDAGFLYASSSGEGGSKSTQTGILIKLGIAAYF